MGKLHLGRRRQRLHYLWLAAAVVDPLSRRLCDAGSVLLCAGVDDVGGQHRHHVRRMVALETGVLKSGLLDCWINGKARRQARRDEKTGNRENDFRFLIL